jgi:peptidoglycan-associated lipoprotein
MSERRRVPVLVAVLCGALLAGACAPKKTVRKPLPSDAEAEAARRRAAGLDQDPATLPSAADIEEMRIRGKEFVVAPDLSPVRFDFDATTVADAGRPALRANADYLRQHPDLEVLVEGHCDERGTTDYNLALGQRRAKAVRDYYMRLGVPGSKIATITFGEERPSCPRSDEDCWAENRRAETKVRARVSSATTTTDMVR